MTIKTWPKLERPREKLLQHGARLLSDAELIAVIIGSGTRHNGVMDIAHLLLLKFGCLHDIIHADKKEICTVDGFGEARFVIFKAALELVRRSLFETMKKSEVLSNPEITRDYLALHMRKYECEVFACLFLDNQHRVIAFEEMFRGTIDGASVHPREVVKRALYHNAAAAIFAHNHPSGSNKPSAADEKITQELKKSLSLVDVRVLDHFVIGESITSFAECNLL